MYWFSRCRPYSPSLDRFWSDGITPVISCMMIEALMYGFIARPTMDIAERPPPANRSMIPNAAFCWKNAARAVRSMPGRGTWASSR